MKEISQKEHVKLSRKQEDFKELNQRKPYKKPMLQDLNATDMIAGGSTSNQLENSSGLIAS